MSLDATQEGHLSEACPMGQGQHGGHTQRGHPSEACPTSQGELQGTLTVSTGETKPLEGLRTGSFPAYFWETQRGTRPRMSQGLL